MKAIRVLQVFTNMNRGGAETMIMNYYRNIDRTKVQFDFLVHRQERGAYEDEIEELGGKIYRISPIHPRYFKDYKKEVKQFLEEHKEYKIIHGHLSELGYFIYREAKKQGIPTIICHAHNSKMSLDCKAPFRWYWKNRCRGYISHMFTCSEASSRWLFGEKNVGRSIQMNNAIDTKKFIFNLDQRNKVRKELGVHNQFVIGHIGRLNKQKNHILLLEIFNKINEAKADTTLVIVGKGEREHKIKNKIKKLGLEDNVIMLKDRDDIDKLLQGFDLFLFPSLFEGLPVTLVEAQASGIHCIVSDKVPKQTIITSLVEAVRLSSSIEEWGEKALKYKDGYIRENMSGKIKEKSFDIEDNAKWLEEFYVQNG